MAVVVTTRPNTWLLAKMPIIYKFTTSGGPFVNYRIEVEVFKASDDTSLTGGVKFSFSPGSDDITYADVSTIIKAYLKAEWIKPTELNEVEEDTSLKFYIKYQELYDGSATSPVDDVANQRQAVYGAFQIGAPWGNDMFDYKPEDDTKKFLRIFDRPKLWRGYPATLSFLFIDGVELNLYRKQYDESGTIIGSEQEDVLDTDEDDAVNRIDILRDLVLSDSAKSLKLRLAIYPELLTNPEFTTELSPWVNVDDFSEDWEWANGRADVTLLDSNVASDQLRQDFDEQPAGTYGLIIEVSNTNNSGDVSLQINVYLSGVLVDNIVSHLFDHVVPETLTFSDIEISGAFDRIQIAVANPSLSVQQTVQIRRVSMKTNVPQDYTETLTFEIEVPRKQPVLLFWKNSVGGDSWWMFDYDQEANYNFSGTKKSKRMVLSDNNLTLDQWEALNELNTLGEIYKENIIELTSSVNKSHVREGSQVYIVDADGNKTGVIVIPTNNFISTRHKRHLFSIEIELPERYE